MENTQIVQDGDLSNEQKRDVSLALEQIKSTNFHKLPELLEELGIATAFKVGLKKEVIYERCVVAMIAKFNETEPNYDEVSHIEVVDHKEVKAVSNSLSIYQLLRSFEVIKLNLQSCPKTHVSILRSKRDALQDKIDAYKKEHGLSGDLNSEDFVNS